MTFFSFFKTASQKQFLVELESVTNALINRLECEEVSLARMEANRLLDNFREAIVKHIKSKTFVASFKGSPASPPDHHLLTWISNQVNGEINSLDDPSYTVTERQGLALLFKITIHEAHGRGVEMDFDPEKMVADNRKRLFG